jgi:hypothetical protein
MPQTKSKVDLKQMLDAYNRGEFFGTKKHRVAVLLRNHDLLPSSNYGKINIALMNKDQLTEYRRRRRDERYSKLEKQKKDQDVHEDKAPRPIEFTTPPPIEEKTLQPVEEEEPLTEKKKRRSPLKKQKGGAKKTRVKRKKVDIEDDVEDGPPRKITPTERLEALFSSVPPMYTSIPGGESPGYTPIKAESLMDIGGPSTSEVDAWTADPF